jgi:hypothetical protein
MNQLTKILFLFFLILVVGNVAAEPALSQTARPTFSTHYEYYKELPTEPASLVVIIIPQDLGEEEIYGIEAYYKTDQYQLPIPTYSNFNVNFQGWGVGDWVCDIGQESLICRGDTALEIGKKSIVAMYFGDNITPPDNVVVNVLNNNGESVDKIEVGSTPSSTTDKEPSSVLPKEEPAAQPTAGNVPATEVNQQAENKKETETSSTPWIDVGMTIATPISVAALIALAWHFIIYRRWPTRRKKKTSKPCPTCNGTGKIKKWIEQEEKVRCPNCQNVPFERCPHCGGTGKSNEAAQWALPKSQAEMKFLPPCDWCQGTGFKMGGHMKGMIPPFTGATCVNCKGRGYTIQKKQKEKEETCPTCKGKGVVPA